MPYPRFRDYICEGMGRKEDLALIGTQGLLKLELEAIELEDSADICNKTRQLTIGTPLMPYTEPTFEDEGKTERLIDDSASIQTSSVNKKKRSRREFETPYSKRPLLNSND